MRRALTFFTPFVGLSFAFGCTTSIQVGTDGQGGHTTTTSSTSSSSTGSTTTSSSSTSSSSSSGTGGGGTGGACGWDGTPVSAQGGPCGGTLWTHPPTCATGLTCIQGSPDAVGTCAPSGTTISAAGGQCGGFVAHPDVCAWDLICQGTVPDAPGTCVQPMCGTTGGGCTNPLVTVDGDGATRQFNFDCPGVTLGSNPTAASGYIGYSMPHAMVPEQVWVNGCLTAGGALLQGSLAIYAQQAVVGTTTTGNVSYDSGTDTYANSGSTTVTVTEMSADTISGTYSASVQMTNGNGVKNISGTFRVCRGPDFLPP